VIVLRDYDPSWPDRFENLRRAYAAAMTAGRVPVVAIEHVGSTAVPGLAAKPRIDCDIVVSADDVEAASAVLVSLGFEPEGELGVPLRWAFREPPSYAGTNTYVVVDACLSLRNHLCVRDTLRAHADLREEYAKVKRAAAARASDLEDYGHRKGPVIQKILTVGGMSAADRASIANNAIPSLTSTARLPRPEASGP
jgi:GrpB-like predicted nucleotidyltransferase (UPF0157 family)